MEDLIFGVGEFVYVPEYDAVGEVIDLDDEDEDYPYLVSFGGGRENWFGPDEVEPEEDE